MRLVMLRLLRVSVVDWLDDGQRKEEGYDEVFDGHLEEGQKLEETRLTIRYGKISPVRTHHKGIQARRRQHLSLRDAT